MMMTEMMGSFKQDLLTEFEDYFFLISARGWADQHHLARPRRVSNQITPAARPFLIHALMLAMAGNQEINFVDGIFCAHT